MTNIKLSAFGIQNFRSIINSGWRTLSNDNITVLIGQNESGKTSILEALHSFYNGEINEDVIRSDDSLPKISCEFEFIGENTLLSYLNKSKIPKDLEGILGKQRKFKLVRWWNEDKSNSLSLTDDTLFAYYQKIEKENEKTKGKTIREIDNLILSNDHILNELQLFEQEKEKFRDKYSEAKKTLEQKKKALKRARKLEQKVVTEKEVGFAQERFDSIHKEFLDREEQFRQTSEKAQILAERIAVGKSCKYFIQQLEEITQQKSVIIQKLAELEHLYGLCSTENGKREIAVKIDAAKGDLIQINQKLSGTNKDVELWLLIASKVYLENIEVQKAEAEARSEIISSAKYYNRYSLAEELFKYLPVFEFFEDFSGLLPNKIDLEDLLNENHQVEGFKAAHNFLKLAGLEPAFFREKNQRILKQRIETLNSDVTINFQDYWSQQVGKDNKIMLHFELEHYDYTVPEKSGKPYLEFWIKDNRERLYPKQRSRGVRWFLSFYLELKAAAIGNNKNRILLIDEPGLSLHARAQEDVLKVFEDLKESMQVIYCTHSPNLVKTEKLYRVLAVQRANLDDDRSESLIFEPAMLSEANADTLTPIYSLMGARISDQQVIKATNNIIVPDTISYYYLYWFSKLSAEFADIQFIPATGLQTVPLLVNILAGWQLNFGTLLFGQDSGNTYEEIIESTLLNGDRTKNQVKILENYNMVEDVLSALDFKKYVLQKRVGITEKNSEYILVNSLSRKILATNFVNSFNEGKIKLELLDETSQTNIKSLFSEIRTLLTT